MDKTLFPLLVIIGAVSGLAGMFISRAIRWHKRKSK